MAEENEINSTLSETEAPTPEANPSPEELPEIAKLHKEAKKWREQLRAEQEKTKALEDRLKALETKPMSDNQPANASPDPAKELLQRLEKLEAELKAEKQTTLRQSVAQELGLPLSVVSALSADDPDQLRQQAQTIKADIDKLTPPTPPTRLSIGNSGQSQAPTTAEELLAGLGRRSSKNNPFAPRG